MPVGASKLGVLGAGLVPGGSVTFNSSGNWDVPPGVKKVSITGRGGTGNPGVAGNPGNPGNPGTGGGGGAGGTRTSSNDPTPEGPSFGGAAWKTFAVAGPNNPGNNNFFFTCVPVCGNAPYPFSCGTALSYGARQITPSTPGINPSSAQAGISGNSGSAGNAGNPGNTGQPSSGLGNTFPGGAGGNAGVAGNAGTGGTGGTVGSNGGNGAIPGGCPAPLGLGGAGGAGGNGGGSGGNGASKARERGNQPFNWLGCFNCIQVTGGHGGGGAGAVNAGQNGINGVAAGPNLPYGPNFPGCAGRRPFGGSGNVTGPLTAPGPFPGCRTLPGNITRPGITTSTMGGSGGISFLPQDGSRGGASVNLISPFSRNPAIPGPGGVLRATQPLFSPIPGIPEVFRSGGGGGAGAAAPSAGNQATGGGGGGGGRGNAGNAGGSSPTPSGAAGTPQTFNCVPVTPGGTAPITVGSPGGQVVISWNPQ